jgi:transposase
MSNKSNSPIATMGIDIGKNAFHVVGLDRRGAIVLRQRWSRGQVQARLANMPPCLIGMEACVGAHHLSRGLQLQGHDARLMPAKYVRPYSKGQKNDFRDAEAIAEAVRYSPRVATSAPGSDWCPANLDWRPHDPGAYLAAR